MSHYQKPVDNEGRTPFSWAVIAQNRELVLAMIAEKAVDVWKPARDIHQLCAHHSFVFAIDLSIFGQFRFKLNF